MTSTEGTITIDGTNIQTCELAIALLMGLVTQDSILFNDTIKRTFQWENWMLRRRGTAKKKRPEHH
jgi:ABC-type transport system involved in Fe-S cluster assembly fused permease/ATPase subunit